MCRICTGCIGGRAQTGKGDGRDLPSGGTGNDRLNGGAGDDPLLGGATSYDAHTAALLDVLKAWTSTDLTGTA